MCWFIDNKNINRCHFVIVVLLLGLNAALLAWLDRHTSPNRTEVGHMAAGLYTWHTSHFDVFHVNPPLPRAIATAPVALCSLKYDWNVYSSLPLDRCEWRLGNAFIMANGFDNAQWYFTLARYTLIPLILLGGYFSYKLAREIFGITSGIFSLALWCFSPTLLAWGTTICPDVAAAALAVVAVYALRLWLREPCSYRAVIAGIVLGLAVMAKFTLLIFYPLWIAIYLVYRLPDVQNMSRRQWRLETTQLALLMVVSIFVVNICYGFDRSLKRLGDYRFQSQMLSGIVSAEETLPLEANRFTDTWMGEIPVPLPAELVQGIDTQRYDFEKGMPSYLRGEWSDHGWWYYYLYAMAVKVPLGTWCLMGLAIGVTIFGRGFNASWRDELLVLAPGLVILIFVSSQTGFSVHLRYVIPALPFFFIWISKIARVFEMRLFSQKRKGLTAAAVVVALTWTVASSLWVYPHSMSYFNELAGGPANGSKHLLGSNLDWGQDLVYLKSWLDKHLQVKLDGLASYGTYSSTLAHIPPPPHLLPNQLPYYSGPHNDNNQNLLGPQPGWYALGVNHLYDSLGEFHYFLDHFTPVASAGYSIYIYHITLDDANRLRRKLKLPEIILKERRHTPKATSGNLF